jgi:hypothetical protein
MQVMRMRVRRWLKLGVAHCLMAALLNYQQVKYPVIIIIIIMSNVRVWWSAKLNNGIAGRCSDATVVVMVAGHHDVTFLSPPLPPAAEKTQCLQVQCFCLIAYLFLTSQ